VLTVPNRWLIPTPGPTVFTGSWPPSSL